MKRFPVVSYLIFFLVIGCSDNQINYTISQKKIDSKKCSVKTTISILPEKGEITLNFRLKNKASEALNINYYGAILGIDSGTSAIPETDKEFKTILKSGETEEYELRYHPVNSPAMFQKTGYRGDLKKLYSVSFDFITDKEGNKVLDQPLLFVMPDTVYSNYIRAYGQSKNYQLFSLECYTDSMIKEQITYLKENISQGKINKSENSKRADSVVLFSGSDIILDNKIVTVAAYRKTDTLYLNLGVINKGRDNLRVQLNKLGLIADGKKYLPLSISSDYYYYNSPEDSTLLLNLDSRFIFQVKYWISEEIQEFKIDRNWLQIQVGSSFKSQNDFIPLLVCDFKFLPSAD